MAWKLTVEEAATVVAEGEFDGEVTGVRDMDDQHAPMVRLEFTLATDDEWDERRVSGLATKKLSENTKLGHSVTAILGRMPAVGEEITIEDLIHKHCHIIIKHKTSPESKVFANAVEVLPARLNERITR